MNQSGRRASAHFLAKPVGNGAQNVAGISKIIHSSIHPRVYAYSLGAGRQNLIHSQGWAKGNVLSAYEGNISQSPELSADTRSTDNNYHIYYNIC